MPTNRIQIKRSTANSVVSGLNPGELAFTANGNILYIGNPADGASVRIAGIQTPGTLTANQALVANATSGIDKVIVNNLELSGAAHKITANGGSGSAGEVLVSGGAGNTYWAPVSALTGSVNTNFAYTWNNTHTFAAGLNVGNSTILTVTNTAITYVGNTTTNPTVSIGTNGNITIGNNSTTQTTAQLALANSVGNSVLTPTTLKVGGSLNVNATQIVVSTTTGINANNSLGTAGQVLASNGTTVYWTNPTVGDITSVIAGNGLLNGGTTGDVTLDVGAGNGITVSADAVAVNAGDGLVANATGVHVVAGNGMFADPDSIRVVAGNTQLVSNTSGVWVNQAQIDHNSLSNYSVNRHIDHTAVTITAGAGLTGGGDISASRTIDIGAGNGITVAADSVAVNAGDGLIANATGLHVVAGNGMVIEPDAVRVLANTNSGLLANATGVHVKVGSGIAFDGSGNLTLAGTISVQDLTVSGNLSVLGDIVTMNVATLSVEDSLITLASGQATSNTFTDALDLGFVGTYGNTANVFYSGLFRDQSDSGIWKLFTSNGAVTNTNVDTANTTLFKLATLESYIKSAGLISNATAVAITANSTLAVSITANTLTLSTPLATSSGGTGQSTYALGDLLVGTAGGSLTKLAVGTSGYVLQSNGTALVYDFLDGGTF